MTITNSKEGAKRKSIEISSDSSTSSSATSETDTRKLRRKLRKARRKIEKRKESSMQRLIEALITSNQGTKDKKDHECKEADEIPTRNNVRFKFPECNKLVLKASYVDYDEWFIAFEGLLRSQGIAEKLWYQALISKLDDDCNIVMTAAPEEVKGNYTTFRDWILHTYGPRTPLDDYEVELTKVPHSKFSPDELFKTIDHIRHKYMRAAKRLGKTGEDCHIRDTLMLRIMLQCTPPGSEDERWLMEMKAQGIPYVYVEPHLRRRLSISYNPRGDHLPQPYLLKKTDNVFCITDTNNQESEERNQCNSIGPIMKQKMIDSGIVGNKGTQNISTGREGKECYYCGRKGHFKIDCDIRKYHENKGFILLRKEQVQRKFDRFKGYENRRVFFIRNQFRNNRRPIGRLRFLGGRRPFYNNQRNNMNRRNFRGRPQRRGVFVADTLKEVSSEDEQEEDRDSDISDKKEDMEEPHQEPLLKDSIDLDCFAMDEAGQTFSMEDLKDATFAISDNNTINTVNTTLTNPQPIINNTPLLVSQSTTNSTTTPFH